MSAFDSSDLNVSGKRHHHHHRTSEPSGESGPSEAGNTHKEQLQNRGPAPGASPSSCAKPRIKLRCYVKESTEGRRTRVRSSQFGGLTREQVTFAADEVRGVMDNRIDEQKRRGEVPTLVRDFKLSVSFIKRGIHSAAYRQESGDATGQVRPNDMPLQGGSVLAAENCSAASAENKPSIEGCQLSTSRPFLGGTCVKANTEGQLGREDAAISAACAQNERQQQILQQQILQRQILLQQLQQQILQQQEMIQIEQQKAQLQQKHLKKPALQQQQQKEPPLQHQQQKVPPSQQELQKGPSVKNEQQEVPPHQQQLQKGHSPQHQHQGQALQQQQKIGPLLQQQHKGPLLQQQQNSRVLQQQQKNGPLLQQQHKGPLLQQQQNSQVLQQQQKQQNVPLLQQQHKGPLLQQQKEPLLHRQKQEKGRLYQQQQKHRLQQEDKHCLKPPAKRCRCDDCRFTHPQHYQRLLDIGESLLCCIK